MNEDRILDGHKVRPFELDPSSDVKIERVAIDEGKEVDNLEILEPRRKSKRWLGWLIGSASIGLLLVLLIETFRYVNGLLNETPLLGIAVAALAMTSVVAAIGALATEVMALRKLRRHEHIHQAAERMMTSALHGGAQPLLKDLSADYQKRPALRGPLGNYERLINDAHDDRESLALFERNVLRPLDREAYKIALASSRDIGIVTALSPLGLIDSALVLIRALMMLRAIARLYGVRPSAFATAALLRRCLRNAALAGLTELVADAAVETAGASLASLISARAGQGMGNGLLAGRLGIEAIKASRPLPFIVEEPPRLRHIRQSLFDKKTNTTN
ncbi:MAG: TIGR01620 family protein [Pseudomonadota bacterium]